MPNYNNKCPNCCAPIKEGDTYCSTCYKPIDRDQTTDGSQLEGIKNPIGICLLIIILPDTLMSFLKTRAKRYFSI